MHVLASYLYVTSSASAHTHTHTLTQTLGVAKSNNWPISKGKLLSEHPQVFHKFINEISLEKLNEVG
jgi:hypothetical protein